MKTKKFLSLVLALAMVFSLSVSVFAEGEQAQESEASSNTFTATATVSVPDIEVTVPSTPGAIFINPMGFTINLEGDDAGEAAAAASVDDDDAPVVATSSEKVASPMYTILNDSPMKLTVFAAPLATPAESNTVISVTNGVAIAEGSTKNDVFIYAQFGEPTPTTDDDDAIVYTPLTQTAFVAPTDTTEVYSTLGIPTKAAKTPFKVGTIKAVTVDDEGNTPGVLGFRFWGKTNDAAKTDWLNAAGESVSVTIAFTFKPDLTA